MFQLVIFAGAAIVFTWIALLSAITMAVLRPTNRPRFGVRALLLFMTVVALTVALSTALMRGLD